MKTEIISWVQIDTPYGKASITFTCKWKSDDADFEKQLNKYFSLESGLVSHEQNIGGLAPFILADQAIRRYGGTIVKVKKKFVEVKGKGE